MTIFTVTISGVTPNPEIYGGLPAALTYASSRFGPSYKAWLVLTPNEQGQTLVQATQYLDLQGWPGTATGLVGVDATTLQWPRSGVTLADGTAVDSATVPPEFVSATLEMAVLILADPNITTKIDQGSNIRSANAGGGVGVEFFNPTSAALGTAPRMPQIVNMLLAKFLVGANPGSVFGGFGQSGNSTSDFATCRQLDDRDRPF